MIDKIIKSLLLYSSFLGVIVNAEENKMNEKYIAQEVVFENKEAGISLAGTLRIPMINDEKSPAVILIHGHGPVDRDNHFMGRRPFLEIAEYLAERGVAVLSYDKRGIGASTGTYKDSTVADYAKDVHAALSFLKSNEKIDSKKIALLGISEGGLVATIVAGEAQSVAAIVLLGPAFLGASDEYIVQASARLIRADGASEEFLKHDAEVRKKVYQTVRSESDVAKAKEEIDLILDQYFAEQSEEQKAEARLYLFAISQEKKDGLVVALNGPWSRNYLSYDPVALLSKVTMPVLMLTAQFDHVAPTEFLSEVVQKGLMNNQAVSSVELPGLHHAFISAKTGGMKEYMDPAPLAESVLKAISTFLEERLK